MLVSESANDSIEMKKYQRDEQIEETKRQIAEGKQKLKKLLHKEMEHEAISDQKTLDVSEEILEHSIDFGELDEMSQSCVDSEEDEDSDVAPSSSSSSSS